MNNDRIARDCLFFLFGVLEVKNSLNKEDIMHLHRTIDRALTKLYDLDGYNEPIKTDEDDYNQQFDTSTNQ